MVRIKFDGIEPLERELKRLDEIRFEAIVTKQATQMYERGQHTPYTPWRTGELTRSMGTNLEVVGYTAEYAPHVEYGHRKLKGGSVKGKRFLKSNIDVQREIYKEDLIKALRGKNA